MKTQRFAKFLIAATATLLLAQSVAAADKHQFTVSSPTITANGAIPEKHYGNNFGCSSSNISPALSWRGAPAGTKSFAITFYDHDAPTGSGLWHWVAYNVPADVTSLDEAAASSGKLPAGIVEGNTDLGKPGWFGPCPPVGRKHHYTYTVYALKTDKLDVPADASPALIGFNLWQQTIAKATLTATAGPRH
ncbi:MAG: YbhB/YbcL family Raf kinase inhibitor-like protein [Gammaproteobacteria bacterium]|nr:YbhB/YbcL family Raf kinase inhibitor-like protein [Gammaproteobacteria bacterium]